MSVANRGDMRPRDPRIARNVKDTRESPAGYAKVGLTIMVAYLLLGYTICGANLSHE